MKFTTKHLKCESYEQVVQQIGALREEWVWALLARFRVDPDILKRARHDDAYSKSEWRDYLIFNFGLQIEDDLSSKKITIKRTNIRKGETLIVGEWSYPEITHMIVNGQKWYEVDLKYYNLV
jgi:hypothetical protein